MLRPRSLLPALVAVAATMGVAPVVAPVGAPAAAAVASAPADPEAPLSLSIETMAPATVPERGRVTLRGRVTNEDDVTWSTINLYPFISTRPLTTRAEIAEAAATEPSAPVGDRVTDGGPYDTIDELAPGESAPYSVSVRARDLRAHVAAQGGDLEQAAGVYWFGVHALGRSADEPGGGAPTADGRARTFLPMLGGRKRQVKTALVVPLRSAITYDDDGSLRDPAAWATTLGRTGELGSVLALGEAAGSRPLTWLLDPALTDATARLAAGNPARSLGSTVDPEATEDPDRLLAEPEDPTASPSGESHSAIPTPEATPPAEEGEEGAEEEVDEPTPAETEAAEAAVAWRKRLPGALDDSQVLTLPYGDLDVAAAAVHDPTAYTRARQRSEDALPLWEGTTAPGLGGRAFLNLDAIQMADDEERLLGSDLMVPGLGPDAPTVATLAGHRLLLASSGAASGGPGPDDPLAGVAVRQRILAEAAVRRLARPREPLVVVLPSRWAPTDPSGFFAGLDQPWLDLTTVDDLRDDRSTPLDTAELVYPRVQERRELDGADFASADSLTEAGVTLQYLLTRNDTVAREVADQAAASLGYASRVDPAASRAVNGRSRAQIQALLDGVRIEGPQKVTLSSTSGRFSATLENTLDQPVTVKVRAFADEPVTITMAEEDVTLPPRSRRSVLLTASTRQQGVHNITLQVTDLAGTAVGAGDRLPIRAAQVSDVIWLIIGTGGALLLGAIGVRLVRRFRAARRTPASEQAVLTA